MNFVSQDRERLNILLVEDDDGDAHAMERAFQKAKPSYHLVRAVDGVDALEILRGAEGKAKLEKPCLMIMDLNMPRMNGVQLLKELRKDEALHPSVVFVLSTSKREQDKGAAYEMNVAGYITKATAGENFQNLLQLVDSYARVVDLP